MDGGVDYVIGADEKHNDVFTFFIISPHTTLDDLGALIADMNPDLKFSKEKFESVFYRVFVNAPNHWFVNVSSDGHRISARSGTIVS